MLTQHRVVIYIAGDQSRDLTISLTSTFHPTGFDFMLKHSLIMATIFGATVSSAFAARHVETFGSLTGSTVTSGGVSTISGGVFNTEFGPPDVSVVTDAVGKYPRTTDSKYLRWTSFTDQYARVVTPAGNLANTSSPIQIAFPIKVNALDPTDNTLDITFVSGTGSQFGVTVVANVMRFASTNGFGTTRTLSTTAFVSGGPGNWADGTWRTLLFRVQPGTAGTGTAKAWVLSTTGSLTLLANYTGISNSNAASGVGLIGFGGSLDVPANRATDISVDNVTVYTTDEFATESAFLNAATADYGPAAAVNEWSLY